MKRTERHLVVAVLLIATVAVFTLPNVSVAQESPRGKATAQHTRLSSIFATWLDALWSPGAPMNQLAAPTETGDAGDDDGNIDWEQVYPTLGPETITTTEPGGDPDPEEEEQITDDG